MSGDATMTNAGVVTVGKLQSRDVAAALPLDTQVLKWNNTGTTWEPANDLVLTETQVDAFTNNNGYAASTDVVAKAGDMMTGDLNLDNESEIQLSEADGNGANYVGFKAPATLTANVIWTLPDTIGAANQVLRNSTTPGILEWATPTTGTGDFLANGSVNMSGNLRLNGNYLSGDGGNEGVFVTSGGSVGIGTNNPRATLGVLINDSLVAADFDQVAGGSATVDRSVVNIRREGDIALTFGGSADRGRIQVPTGNDLVFREGTTTNLTVAAGGNLGVGTDAPNGQIDVDGDLNMREMTTPPGVSSTDQGRIYFDSVSNKFRVSENGNTYVDLVPSSGLGSGDFLANGAVPMAGPLNLNGNFISGDGDTEGLFVDAQGEVGVGTSNPLDEIHIYSSSPNLRMQDADTGASARFATSNSGSLLFYADQTNVESSSVIAFNIDASEQLRINSSGNVGIGTVVPGTKLDVEGRITSGPIDATSGNTGSLVLQELAANGVNSVGLRAPDLLATDLLWTLPDSLGTANQVLRNSAVPGVLEWATPTTGTGDFLADGSIPMTGNIRLNGEYLSGDGGNEGVFVDSSGRVGIGTSLPTGILTVDGGTAPASTSGSSILLEAQNGSFSGFGNNGGSVILRPGNPGPAGSVGSIILDGSTSVHTLFELKPSTEFPISGRMRFYEASGNGSHYVNLEAPDALAGSYSLTLPETLGASSQFLQTDGSGNLQWATVTPGTGDLRADGSVAMTGNLNLGGNSLIGGTASGADLTLESTTDATKGDILLAPNGGSVGIGTTAPADDFHIYDPGGGEHLVVETGNSSSSMLRINNSAQVWELGMLANENFVLRDASNSNAQVFEIEEGAPGGSFFMNNIGHVGIGTSAPGSRLDVLGPTSGGGHLLQLASSNGGDTLMSFKYPSSSERWLLGTDADGNTSDDFILWNTDRATFDLVIDHASGNVGIGTSSPSSKFHMFGSNDDLLIESDDAVGATNSADIEFRRSRSGGAVLDDDRLGSIYFLGHKGAGGFSAANRNAFIRGEVDGTPGTAVMPTRLTFGTSGDSTHNATERMRITSSGEVGIGTEAPQSKLSVDGAITNASAILDAADEKDFATGNIQYTTEDCGAFDLRNLKSGGSYTFIVQGTTSATCSFTAYSSSNTSAPLTVHMPVDHGATTDLKHTIYSIVVAGTHAYFAWATGL